MTSHISSVMGFLTTSLHKNCHNNVKLLETWWFWPILRKVERAELTCDVIKKSCSTFLIKFWLYLDNWQTFLVADKKVLFNQFFGSMWSKVRWWFMFSLDLQSDLREVQFDDWLQLLTTMMSFLTALIWQNFL